MAILIDKQSKVMVQGITGGNEINNRKSWCRGSPAATGSIIPNG